MTTRQQDFAAALLDPDRAVPDGLIGAAAAAAGRRFDVYRNNVAASLIDALATGFQVVRALVGEAFFRAMAGDFVRRHPPRSPILTVYGAALPDYLAGFAPVAHLPYLPDVARLELALRESYHAADAAPIDPAALATLPAARLPFLRLHLAPALRVLRSDWPIHAIWAAHHGGPKPVPGPQEVLVARPGFDPVAHVLPRGGFAVLSALRAGNPLGAALSAAGDDFDESNISALLALLLDSDAICGTELEETP